MAIATNEQKLVALDVLGRASRLINDSMRAIQIALAVLDDRKDLVMVDSATILDPLKNAVEAGRAMHEET